MTISRIRINEPGPIPPKPIIYSLKLNLLAGRTITPN
jgi:hypothetical protein